MERIGLRRENIEDAARRAAGILRAGGVVLYPTDTLYGLGTDALSDAAVSEVYGIKGRAEGKPMHCIVADLATAGTCAQIHDQARMLAEEFWPGALTLILEKKPGITTGVARGIATIGIRIPDNAFCLALARRFGGPYTATSANASGVAAPRRVPAILSQLGTAARKIGLAIDAGELPASAPSTVVDLSSEGARILREGAIPASDIFAYLGH